MSTVNAANLQLKLLEKTTRSDASCDPSISILMASKAFQEMKLQKLNSVKTYYNLPTPSASLLGQIWYVSNEREFYTVVYEIGSYLWRTLAGFSSSVFSWGSNGFGQLGQNTTISKTSPITIVGSNNSWCQISSGYGNSAGVKTDGTLWIWGGASSGQLGDNSTSVSRSSPVTTSGYGVNWCQVSVAGYCTRHTAAVKTDGTLWTWGRNDRGQIGDNSVVYRSSPITTSGGGTTWCFVSTGTFSTASVKTDGSLWLWGANCFGMLGDNTTVSKSSPVSTVGGGSTWCTVSLAHTSAGAIKTDGTLWTWGQATYGALGSNSILSRSSPATVSGGGTTWCQVTTNLHHMAAVKNDGTLWTWGRNNCGQLGDNTTTSKSSPITVSAGGTTWCNVSAGYRGVSAVKTNGTLWTWGDNNSGQLGDNTVTPRSSPGTTVGNGSLWCSVFSGRNNTLGILRTC